MALTKDQYEEHVYAIMQKEYDTLCNMQEIALKKGCWRDMYEYDAMKIMIKHLIKLFDKIPE